MYKVIIVDDETLVRVGIKMGIDWESNGFVFAGEASNATAAIELCKAVCPDIVIADVNMPGLNGIEMMKEIKSFMPHVRFVMLSGYDDYQYVRQSMKLGAYDYLLKLDMDPQNLLDILKSLAQQLNQEQRGQGKDQPKPHAAFQWPAGESVRCVFIVLDEISALEEKLQGKDRNKHLQAVENVIRQALADDLRTLTFMGDWRWAAAVSGWEEEQTCHRAWQAMADVMGLYFSQSIRFGVSPVFTQQEQLAQHGQLAAKAAEKAQKADLRCVVYTDSMERATLSKEVEKAIRFIKENENRAVSLRDVAAHCMMSAAYLSRLFNVQTGQSITEYIARHKVEKAKELLRTTDLRVYEIAERVGYTDEHYFNRVFKRYTNQSPRDFRNRKTDEN